MNIMVIGNHGNMGRRYSAILRHLGVSVIGHDVQHEAESGAVMYFDIKVRQSSGIIIATPTRTHLSVLMRVLPHKKPVLCEKPFAVGPALEVERVVNEYLANHVPLAMVNQYEFLAGRDVGPTSYDYWNHGQDGLVWDAINIIEMARGTIELKEESPIWTCRINGDRIDPGQMDSAYVAMIEAWIKSPFSEPKRIIDAHTLAHEVNQHGRRDRGGIYWHPGAH